MDKYKTAVREARLSADFYGRNFMKSKILALFLAFDLALLLALDFAFILALAIIYHHPILL